MHSLVISSANTALSHLCKYTILNDYSVIMGRIIFLGRKRGCVLKEHWWNAYKDVTERPTEQGLFIGAISTVSRKTYLDRY